MKRVLLVLVTIVLASFSAHAQGINGARNAIGIRGAYGVELDYQRYVAPANRIEASLGINRYGFNAAGVFQWMFDIRSNTKGQFKWYAGPGVALGDWYKDDDDFADGFSVGILGQIGIEYAFAAPVMMSLDYRPGLYFAPEVDFDWSGFALGVRFYF